MAGEAVDALRGLPALLRNFALAIAEMDKEMSKSGLETVLAMAEAGPALAQDLGITNAQVMEILNILVARTMRVAAAEVIIRGDVNVRTSLEVGAKLEVGFAPYVSLGVTGGYARQTGENWGSEVRLSMAALPPDTKMIADFIQRFQEREGTPNPEAIDFIRDLLPELREFFKDVTNDPTPD